jgi:hypothetical protein
MQNLIHLHCDDVPLIDTSLNHLVIASGNPCNTTVTEGMFNLALSNAGETMYPIPSTWSEPASYNIGSSDFTFVFLMKKNRENVESIIFSTSDGGIRIIQESIDQYDGNGYYTGTIERILFQMSDDGVNWTDYASPWTSNFLQPAFIQTNLILIEKYNGNINIYIGNKINDPYATRVASIPTTQSFHHVLNRTWKIGESFMGSLDEILFTKTIMAAGANTFAFPLTPFPDEMDPHFWQGFIDSTETL